MGNTITTLFNYAEEHQHTPAETTKKLRNEYLTWSVTLYGFYKNVILGLNVEEYEKIKDTVFAYRLDTDMISSGCATPLSTDDAEVLKDPCVQHITLDTLIKIIRTTHGDDLTLKDFKGFDLGGRDQTKMMAALGDSTSDAPSCLGKFTLMTGGKISTRLSTLRTFICGSDVHSPCYGVDATKNFFVLSPKVETVLTTVSIYDHVKENVNEYTNTLILCVGSTDAHIGFIDGEGNIRTVTVCLYNHSASQSVIQTAIKDLVGGEEIWRVIFGGSFLFGLEYRKFMLSPEVPITGVDIDDIDLTKGLFTKISPITGDILLGKILCSQGSSKDIFNFDFIVNTSKKGDELKAFLSAVFNNEYMQKQLNENVFEMLSFSRSSPPELCDEEICTMITQFGDCWERATLFS